MGAPREWQVVHGTTPTVLPAGTIKVSAHLAPTPHARLNARDRKSVSSTPNPVSRVNSLPRLRGSTGKSSKSRDGSAAVESESPTHPANRNAAVTNDGDRGLPHPASAVNAVMNATEPVRPALTRPLCDRLTSIVHLDRNCSSRNESDCIRSDLIKTDLHDLECSSVFAGIVVDAPLNVSSALSPLTSLAQSHSASEQVPSVHTSRLSQLQGEYPPRVVTRVRGGLPPPSNGYDGVSPKGLPSELHLASPAYQDGVYPLVGVPSAGGKILGLVAPLTGVADSSPVAEFDQSGHRG